MVNVDGGLGFLFKISCLILLEMKFLHLPELFFLLLLFCFFDWQLVGGMYASNVQILVNVSFLLQAQFLALLSSIVDIKYCPPVICVYIYLKWTLQNFLDNLFLLSN